MLLDRIFSNRSPSIFRDNMVKKSINPGKKAPTKLLYREICLLEIEFYNLKASPFRAGMANSYKLPKALVLEELYGFW